MVPVFGKGTPYQKIVTRWKSLEERRRYRQAGHPAGRHAERHGDEGRLLGVRSLAAARSGRPDIAARDAGAPASPPPA